MERRSLIASLALAGLPSRAGSTPAPARSADPAPAPTSAPAPAPAGTPANPGLPSIAHPGELRGEMLYRPLGDTGEQVSALGLGGSHFARTGVSESESLRLLHAAIDRGLTFLDNSWDYNGGESEIRMGKGLAQGNYRQRAFLMTKIDGRSREAAAKQIDDSLRRLRTDRIDLLQHHEVLRFDDPDRIFARGGAMEAVVAARQAGKVRYIGFSGHKDPQIHLYMLETAARHGFHFDTVQMPLNVMDAHYRSFARLVLPRLLTERIGVLGMKALGGGDGIILKSGAVTAIECLHYALNLPTSVVITGIDNDTALNQAFEVAKTFRPMDPAQVAALLARTQPAAANGEYELFKISAHFDQTAKHADWLGGESPDVRRLAPRGAG